MKTRLFATVLLGSLAISVGVDAQQRFPQADVERGAYLAIAGDCAACHNAPGGSHAPMAGGYPIVSPIGTIYASNITPSRINGIGAYSEAQFASALRDGVRADGANLYPAMPYTAYAGLSDVDVHALYAYFMQGVAPINRDSRKTDLPFPFSIRLSMSFWNALFLRKGVITPDPGHDAEWNRGHYLAEALGHCSACHTPRGLLMQERNSVALSGGALGAWYAPNITSDKIGGIGGWSRVEIAQYLSTGRVAGKAQAAGDMADAVTNSFSRMAPDDINAMASYIATIPPVREAGATQPNFTIGTPGRFEAGLRGTTDAASGAHLYSGMCASCHGSNGQGTADGTLPSLFHNSTVGATRPDNLIAVILYGVDRSVGDHHVLMPAFGAKSFVQSPSDAQIASLATFVRQKFGPGDSVTDAQVALARKGGSPSILLLLSRLGLVGAVVLLAGVAIWTFRRRRRHQHAAQSL